MKALYFFLWILLILLAGCGKSSSEYMIEGRLPSSAYDGEWIYLAPAGNLPGRIDSARIINCVFIFKGKIEELKIVRMRPVLRLKFQELLVVTEPGKICVKIDSIGVVSGTPQNDALQTWKAARERIQRSYRFVYDSLCFASGNDSLLLLKKRDFLRLKEKEINFSLLKNQKNTTLGKFMKPMLYATLTEKQRETLDEISQ
jgi:hypothetical protein